MSLPKKGAHICDTPKPAEAEWDSGRWLERLELQFHEASVSSVHKGRVPWMPSMMAELYAQSWLDGKAESLFYHGSPKPDEGATFHCRKG